MLVSRWVGAVWGAALHNQSRRSWFGSWPVFGERVGGIILVIFGSDLDLRLRTIRTKVFSHKGKGNWSRTQLDSKLVDRMNWYYYISTRLSFDLTLEIDSFSVLWLFLACCNKKCLKPLTLRKFIQLFPNSIQNICKFWAIYMKEQFQGLKAEKRLAFFSLADSNCVPLRM